MVLFLIDVSGLIFRAFHALPALTGPEGQPIGAVYGFCKMLMKLRGEISAKVTSRFDGDFDNNATGQTVEAKPAKTMVIGVFDVSRKTFRHEIYSNYKANRQETPPELRSQFPLVREACTAFGCAVKEMADFEADDVIASYAKKAVANNISAVIVSSDKDFMQLFRRGMHIFDPMKSIWITEQHIIDKFGVRADRVVDVQSLAGDPTDGVSGAHGIGVKKAAELINQFGSLDTLLEHAHAISQKKRRDLILTHMEDIRTARQLVTLRADLNVEINEGELLVPFAPADGVSAFYKKYGLVGNGHGANNCGNVKRS